MMMMKLNVIICYLAVLGGVMGQRKLGQTKSRGLKKAKSSKRPSNKECKKRSKKSSEKPIPIPIQNGLQPDCLVDDPVKFNICFDVISDNEETQDWMKQLLLAKQRWEEIIVEDRNHERTVIHKSKIEKTEFLVDDIVIRVTQKGTNPDDGFVLATASILTSYPDPDSGPTALSAFRGKITFYSDAITDSLLASIFLHEIGHVLGIGLAWDGLSLTAPSAEDESKLIYTGPGALGAWKDLGCTRDLPVASARGHHWDICVADELMTFFPGDTPMLSTLTIGALEDLGYGVDYCAADDFDASMLGDCCFGDTNAIIMRDLEPVDQVDQAICKLALAEFHNQDPEEFPQSAISVIYTKNGKIIGKVFTLNEAIAQCG